MRDAMDHVGVKSVAINITKHMRVLLYDIETTPNLGYTWGKYEQNVIEFTYQSELLCIAYKWLDEDTVHFIRRKRTDEDDKRIVEEFTKVMLKADVIIAHNGDSFDNKIINTRTVYHGLSPLPKLRTVDTLKVARKYFRFNSNSLNDLGSFLGLGSKVSTGGIRLWLGCMEGDRESWRLMEEYNKQDVLLLEKIYLRLRPFMSNHPNVNVLDETIEPSCPTCGKTHLQKRGFHATVSGKAQRYQCQDCGSWSKGSITRTVTIKS